jgi:hypothetical protein
MNLQQQVEHYRKMYNTAVANKRLLQARRINRVLMSLEARLPKEEEKQDS